MMERDRKREGLRICRAAWLIGVSVREYREIVAGDRMPSLDTYRRISELYAWPQTFEGSVAIANSLDRRLPALTASEIRR
jgi:hypothetical protein